MKKKNLNLKNVLKVSASSLCAAAALGMMSLTAMAGPANAGVGQAQTAGAETQAAYIGESKAQEIALSNAGLSSDQVTILKSKLKWDDGHWQYEVEFYKPDDFTEFDYEIDAYAGTILSLDYDVEYSALPSAGADTADYISLDQAKSIALDWVGLKSDQVSFKKARLDRDDGRVEYKVEFYSGEYEYEFKINAVNGTVLDYDRDYLWD